MIDRKGFTLAEIMVVVVLLTIVSGAVFSLYSIGLRTSQIAGERSEAVAEVRFIQKLLERKATVMAGDCYSTYMAKDGLLNLIKNNRLGEIINVPLNSPNNDQLYLNVGVNDFGTYKAENLIYKSTMSVLINKMNDFGINYSKREDFKGAYLFEYSREVLLNELSPAKADYVLKLTSEKVSVVYAKCLVSDFSVSRKDLLTVSAGANVSLDCTGVKPLNLSDNTIIHLNTPPSNPGKVLELLAVSETNFFPMEMDPQYPEETSHMLIQFPPPFKKYFFYPANIFSDICMLFYDIDDLGAVTNHAIYITNDRLDETGKQLYQIRYSFCRFKKGTEFREEDIVDDVVISGLSGPKFKYYNKSDKVIEMVPEWKWHPGNEVAKVELNLEKSVGGYKINSRVSVNIDTSYEGDGK